jgi:hypothetical protein
MFFFCRLEEEQSTYIQRVPQCMSPRRNWDSPNPSLASECAPPPRIRGAGEEGHTSLRVRGWGSLNSDNLRKSLALCLLCGWREINCVIKSSILSSKLEDDLHRSGTPPPPPRALELLENNNTVTACDKKGEEGTHVPTENKIPI